MIPKDELPGSTTPTSGPARLAFIHTSAVVLTEVEAGIHEPGADGVAQALMALRGAWGDLALAPWRADTYEVLAASAKDVATRINAQALHVVGVREKWLAALTADPQRFEGSPDSKLGLDDVLNHAVKDFARGLDEISVSLCGAHHASAPQPYIAGRSARGISVFACDSARPALSLQFASTPQSIGSSSQPDSYDADLARRLSLETSIDDAYQRHVSEFAERVRAASIRASGLAAAKQSSRPTRRRAQRAASGHIGHLLNTTEDAMQKLQQAWGA